LNSDFILGNNVTVSFVGGFDGNFNTTSGVTVIQGKLSINNGQLRVKNLKLKNP
jgi:hypothetical protein